MSCETIQAFSMSSTLQAPFLLQNNDGNLMLRSCGIFNVMKGILWWLFDSTFLNYTFPSIFGSESMLIVNVPPFFQNWDMLKGNFQHLIELPVNIPV